MSDDLNYADWPRTDWYPRNGRFPFGDPVVRSSSGAPRPRLGTPLEVFTVHYVGAGAHWLDSGDTLTELAAIEANHAIPNRKPNEYNSASDVDGETFGYAGPYRAAHSGGNNGTSWGHLVVVGVEVPSEAQADGLIAGVRKMRRQLVDAGFLTPDHRVVPHRNMPRANTGCPGVLYDNDDWWDRIAAPLDAPAPEIDMHKFIKPKGYKDQFLIIPMSAETKRRIGDVDAPFVEVEVDDVPAFEDYLGYGSLTPE